MQSNRKKLETAGAIQVDLTYKATHTPMRKGKAKRDLPPPKVKIKKPPPPPPQVVKKEPPKPKKQKKPSPEEKREKLAKLIDKFREQEGKERKKKPREDNFPTREDGEEKAFGTGGRATRALTPAELALQSAMRKHFEMPNASQMREQYPNAEGYLSVRLIGVGNRLEIVSLSILQSSGFSILDRSCESAVQKAITEEVFAQDVIRELSGKENTIRCQF